MATKRYLDYAGLKRVLAKLLPGARKIWHGTLAEWKALSEAERDKYDQAEIIDGSGYQSDYIRNLHDPDWAGAVKLTANTLYLDGFIAPGNGIIVGSFAVKNRIVTLDCMIEGVTVAQAITAPSINSCTSNIQCPINQGNEIILNCREGNLIVSDITTEMYFVPYKAQ